ncbi:uncharacterized protein [Aristolochia californica]|uniref:uncharacterized protein n=1 Tax=Aristolochia californica TaxID=171875 RepID=UPI0035E099A1
MAYIPPHKRHSSSKPSPTPEKFIPQFEKKLSRGLHARKGQHSSHSGKYAYAPISISRWLPIGLMDDGLCPPSVKLLSIPCEVIGRRSAENPWAFVHDRLSKDENEMKRSSIKSPWLSITEEILSDLQTAAQHLRREMDIEDSLLIRPSLVARFGKIFFHGGPSIEPDNILKSAGNKVHTFYTSIPDSYVEFVQSVAIPRLAVEFESEKEHYHVKVYDKLRPKSTISCKCTVKKDGGGLVILVMELNQVRHLVVDVSCLDKDLDVRLMLYTKTLITNLTEEEEQGIRELINSAVIDPDVRGGVRWPLGKQTFLDRFSVVGVWHTKYRAFRSPMMRLKLRNADRFDFRTSMGERAEEVTLKMTGMAKQLLDRKAEESLNALMLKEMLRLIWENFLSCQCSFTWSPK